MNSENSSSSSSVTHKTSEIKDKHNSLGLRNFISDFGWDNPAFPELLECVEVYKAHGTRSGVLKL